MDIIDVIVILYLMVWFCGVVDLKDGDFLRFIIVYCIDVVFIFIGVIFGFFLVMVFIESGVGIVEGGWIGFIVMVIGLCFVVFVFFVLIFVLVLLWVIGCILILVGFDFMYERFG